MYLLSTRDTYHNYLILIQFLWNKCLHISKIFVQANPRQKHHVSVIRLHIVPHLGNKKVASLTTSTVQKFYNKLLSEGKSGSLVRDTHLILHQAMDVAVKENLIAKNPTSGTKIPKVEYKPKNILNEIQLEMFMEAIKEDELWYDFFYTEITIGLRRGELCGLKWCDFNEITGQLNVVRTVTTHKGGVLKAGETKPEKGTRTIYLPPSTVKLLSERKPKVSSEWIFPNFYDNSKPINPSTAYLKLKSILFPASVLVAAKVSKNERIKQKAIDECIPEFRRFNIIESEIRNVI